MGEFFLAVLDACVDPGEATGVSDLESASTDVVLMTSNVR